LHELVRESLKGWGSRLSSPKPEEMKEAYRISSGFGKRGGTPISTRLKGENEKPS